MGLFFILLLAAGQAPAQEAPVFRAGVSLVRVDVQVLEGERALPGLAQEDFEVYDEGERREIAYFGRDSEPLSLVLLLDVSGSMRSYLDQMAQVARQALGRLGPEDRVAVMLFSRRSQLRADFTTNHTEVAMVLKSAVREKGLGGGSDLNPALLEAAAYIRKQAQPRPERRAILTVTDNAGMHYRSPDEEVLRALYAADTVLNAIVAGDARRPEPPAPGQYLNPDFTPADVFRLAEESGGEVLKAGRAEKRFPEMMERLRTRYSIHYRPPEAAPGTFRRIRVELSPAARKRHPKAQVRARGGYYAEAVSQSQTGEGAR